MIQNHAPITADAAEVLKALNANRYLHRAAFAGVPFRVTFDNPEPGQPQLQFPEDLILTMIDQGLLVALQQAAAWVERGIPARPFTVRMTKDGEKARVRLISGVIPVANDAAPVQSGRAA